MPVLSYIHQLFNADICHVCIHTLRWQDRPCPCPRCQSQDVDPWGTYHYRPGCERTFNDLTMFAHHLARIFHKKGQTASKSLIE